MCIEGGGRFRLKQDINPPCGRRPWGGGPLAQRVVEGLRRRRHCSSVSASRCHLPIAARQGGLSLCKVRTRPIAVFCPKSPVGTGFAQRRRDRRVKAHSPLRSLRLCANHIECRVSTGFGRKRPLPILPQRGRGTTRRVVEGYGRSYAALDTAYPSTMLRMVPLPVPGRIASVRSPPQSRHRQAAKKRCPTAPRRGSGWA